MAWWAAIPYVISAVGAVAQSNSANAQNSNQLAWNKYNATMGYYNAMDNIKINTMLGLANAQMAMNAGRASAMIAFADADFNAKVVRATTQYNDMLLEDEIEQTWDAMDLDIELLRMARSQERGELEAEQSASGTVMGMGSNAEVIISQQAQEELEAFIIMRGADRTVRDLQNTRAQNLWQGEMEARKILFEGKLSGMGAMFNASTQAAGIALQTRAGALADRISATNSLFAGLHGSNVQFNSNKTQISNNLTSSLVSTASRGIERYYEYKSLAINE